MHALHILIDLSDNLFQMLNIFFISKLGNINRIIILIYQGYDQLRFV